ncbi:MAG: OB-fold nucleic acid binding domain-containing protein [Candidatus Bathyarchaeota archaeon]|nr:OB-fold nucleic acid binding domain-containing protein [Candidatus Bathyarchaeota archaeon]
MTTQDIIQEILQKNQQISQEQILERLEAERAKTGGLLGDETLLRLIAAKFGVQVQQNSFHNSGILSTGRLFAGLNDVTVAGRLIAVFPVKTFQGAEKSGKFATVILADNEGLLRVVLWDKKADAIESGELKAGLAVRLLHGYTRQDRYGKTELHLGGKSQIEITPEDTAYPSLEKFTAKIKSLHKDSGNVHLLGTVKAILSRNTFPRNSEGEGAVMRVALADESGETTLVVWNEQVLELEKKLEVGMRLLVVNARVKESQNSCLEVHVDSNTFVDAQKAN